MAALPRAVADRLTRSRTGLPGGRSLRAVAYSPPALRLSGWRKDGRHVPPYSTWKAKQEAEQQAAAVEAAARRPAAPPLRSRIASQPRNVRLPPLGPMIDPRWVTAFSFCKDLAVTYHLASDSRSAALPLAEVRTLVLNPLGQSLSGVRGSLSAGQTIVGGPLSIALTFTRAVGAQADPADDTVFAVTHAADLAGWLAGGNDVESLSADLQHLRLLPKSRGKTVLFVLDLAVLGTTSSETSASEAVVRQTLRSAELENRSQMFVNYIDSTGTPPPAIALHSFIAALAEGPHRRHKDDVEYIRQLTTRS